MGKENNSKETHVPLARIETGAKTSSATTLRETVLAAGVLMVVKAVAVAAMERTASESFMVVV